MCCRDQIKKYYCSAINQHCAFSAGMRMGLVDPVDALYVLSYYFDGGNVVDQMRGTEVLWRVPMFV